MTPGHKEKVTGHKLEKCTDLIVGCVSSGGVGGVRLMNQKESTNVIDFEGI